MELTQHKINKLHKKVRDIRLNYIHNITRQLVIAKPERIVIENLDVVGMLKNKHLSRAVARSGFNMFKRILMYKTKEHGISLIVADRFFASSKICSKCKNYKKDLKLKDRVYKCIKCDNEIDRDLNASINLANYVIIQ